jgi:hypothetical protein
MSSTAAAEYSWRPSFPENLLRISQLHFSTFPLIVCRMFREIHISASAFFSSLLPGLLLPLFLLVR